MRVNKYDLANHRRQLEHELACYIDGDFTESLALASDFVDCLKWRTVSRLYQDTKIASMDAISNHNSVAMSETIDAFMEFAKVHKSKI